MTNFDISIYGTFRVCLNNPIKLDTGSQVSGYMLSAPRQKGVTTSHLYTQLDPFALKLTMCALLSPHQ